MRSSITPHRSCSGTHCGCGALTATARYSGGEGGVIVTGDAAWFADLLDRKLYRIPFDS